MEWAVLKFKKKKKTKLIVMMQNLNYKQSSIFCYDVEVESWEEHNFSFSF